jgi:hypothetical protein
VRLRLLLRGSSRGPSRSGGRAAGGAARRGGSGTALLTRHLGGYVWVCLDECKREMRICKLR